MMKSQVFYDIANIVERDNKSTTYKYALLRGVIEIIQENSPYIRASGDKMIMPLGALVYKFILYYYPILQAEMESGISIPQIGNGQQLAIRNALLEFIEKYKNNGGLSAFNRDLRGRGIDPNSVETFIELARITSQVIRKMPMKHIGYSLSGSFYSIFTPEENGRISSKVNHIDLKYLIDVMGTFSIPTKYYQALKNLGSFISGRDSILFKWAEFSVNLSNKPLSIERALSDMLKEPIDQRNVLQAAKFYKTLIEKHGMLNCVWTGKQLKSTYHVDHVIPYSVWSNNDLWNLLPAQGAVNGRKKDKIPSPELIEKRKNDIILCWEGLYTTHPERFTRELQVSLIGSETLEGWQTKAITQLQKSCDYLINQRGFQSWNG